MPRRATPSSAPSRDVPTANDLVAAQVLRQFRQIFNTVRSHFQRVEASVGLGGAQVWALSVIAESPGIGVSRLARAMTIHQSTASSLVKTLVERGLVGVKRDASDRRAVMLRLLPAGVRLLERSPGPFAGVLPGALAALDPKTLARMEADLKLLIGELHPHSKSARTPLADL